MKSSMNKDELNRWIGTQIQKRRMACNFSQERLSELVGLSPNFIYKLENGQKAASIYSYYRIDCRNPDNDGIFWRRSPSLLRAGMVRVAFGIEPGFPDYPCRHYEKKYL